MNGLHDLLEKLKKLEEAATAPTTFTPNYYHKNNFGFTTPLMMTDPGVFWHMASATNDDGGGRGGRQTIQQWYGNTESRDALSPASVDGKMINGKPGPEFPPGTTWRTDLATAEKAKADAQNAQKVSSANTGGASSALVQNREQLAPGTVASETGSDGVTYGVDANGQRTYKLDTQQQKWVQLATPVPAEQGELGGQVKPVPPVPVAVATPVRTNTIVSRDINIDKQILRVKELIGNVAKEGIVFKSRIGTALLESFNLALNEAPQDDAIRAELDPLFKSLVQQVTDKKITGPQAEEITQLRPQVEKWLKDHPSTVAPAKDKTLAPVDPGTIEMQKWLKGKGYDIGVFGEDGRWGPDTENAVKAFWADYNAGKYKGTDTLAQWQKLVNATKDTDYSRSSISPASKINPLTGQVGGDSQKVRSSTATTQLKTEADYDAAMLAQQDKVIQAYKKDPNGEEYKAAFAELTKLIQGKVALTKSAKPTGGPAAYTTSPEYTTLLAKVQSTFKAGTESPAYKQALADFEAYIKTQTPLSESTGFANEELSRIVSLVHHR